MPVEHMICWESFFPQAVLSRLSVHRTWLQKYYRSRLCRKYTTCANTRASGKSVFEPLVSPYPLTIPNEKYGMLALSVSVNGFELSKRSKWTEDSFFVELGGWGFRGELPPT